MRMVRRASLMVEMGTLIDAGAVKMNNIRRYLRAARALYEMQFQMKRPSAILKMKPNAVRRWRTILGER
jgi:hypothetical protein